MKRIIIHKLKHILLAFFRNMVIAVIAISLYWFVGEQILHLPWESADISKWLLILAGGLVLLEILNTLRAILGLIVLASRFETSYEEMAEAIIDFKIYKQKEYRNWTPQEFWKWLNSQRTAQAVAQRSLEIF